MSDLKKFAEDLVSQTSKEAQKLAKVLKEEFGIEAKAKKEELPSLQIKNYYYVNSKTKKKNSKQYPRRK